MKGKQKYQNRLQVLEQQLKTLHALKKQDEIDVNFREQRLTRELSGFDRCIAVTTKAITRHLACLRQSIKESDTRSCFTAWKQQTLRRRFSDSTEKNDEVIPGVVGVDVQEIMLLSICFSTWRGSVATKGTTVEIHKSEADKMLKQRTKQLHEALNTLEQCSGQLGKEEELSKELVMRYSSAAPVEVLEVENLALKKKLEGFAAVQYKYGVLQLQLQQRGAHLSQALAVLESCTQDNSSSQCPSVALL